MYHVLFTISMTAVVLACAAAISAAQEIDPINSWNGKHHSDELRTHAPANNSIRDLRSWQSLWENWRPGEPVPEIDFDKYMVVVVTVGGPNKVQIKSLTLGANGNLQFNAISTMMGGPGFGYNLVQVPHAGIKAINGTALKDINQQHSQPADDSIQIEIVGTVRTDVVAIGGETTGTTITAKGMTFELDFNRLPSAIKSHNGKRLRVSGELNVKQGVEIKQRLIVKVAHFQVLPDGQAQTDGEHKQPVAKAFKQLIIEKSGGFAGIRIRATITPDGQVTRENSRERITESFDLKASVVAELHKLIGHTDWSSVPRETLTENAADLFQYQFTIETDKIYQLTIDDLALDKVPALKNLLQQLNPVFD